MCRAIIAPLSAVMGCKRAAGGKLAMLFSIVMSVGRGSGAIGLVVLCAVVVGTCGSCGAVARAERMSEISWIAWSAISDPVLEGGFPGPPEAVE